MDLLKPLFALLAIVNPIGVVPFFIHFTQTLSREQRRHTIRITAIKVFLVIAVSACAGGLVRMAALRWGARFAKLVWRQSRLFRDGALSFRTRPSA